MQKNMNNVAKICKPCKYTGPLSENDCRFMCMEGCVNVCKHGPRCKYGDNCDYGCHRYHSKNELRVWIGKVSQWSKNPCYYGNNCDRRCKFGINCINVNCPKECHRSHDKPSLSEKSVFDDVEDYVDYEVYDDVKDADNDMPEQHSVPEPPVEKPKSVTRPIDTVDKTSEKADDKHSVAANSDQFHRAVFAEEVFKVALRNADEIRNAALRDADEIRNAALRDADEIRKTAAKTRYDADEIRKTAAKTRYDAEVYATGVTQDANVYYETARHDAEVMLCHAQEHVYHHSAHSSPQTVQMQQTT